MKKLHVLQVFVVKYLHSVPKWWNWRQTFPKRLPIARELTFQYRRVSSSNYCEKSASLRTRREPRIIHNNYPSFLRDSVNAAFR